MSNRPVEVSLEVNRVRVWMSLTCGGELQADRVDALDRFRGRSTARSTRRPATSSRGWRRASQTGGTASPESSPSSRCSRRSSPRAPATSTTSCTCGPSSPTSSAATSRTTPTRTWRSSAPDCAPASPTSTARDEPVYLVDLDGVNGRPGPPAPDDHRRLHERRGSGARAAGGAGLGAPDRFGEPQGPAARPLRAARGADRALRRRQGPPPINLAPGERQAGLTVNEYETLLMRHDLAEVLREPLRFMAEKGRSILAHPRAIPNKTLEYAKSDMVRVFNQLFDAFRMNESMVEKLVRACSRIPLTLPADEALGQPARLRSRAGRPGRPVQGIYQSPILVQWEKAARQQREIDDRADAVQIAALSAAPRRLRRREPARRLPGRSVSSSPSTISSFGAAAPFRGALRPDAVTAALPHVERAQVLQRRELAPRPASVISWLSVEVQVFQALEAVQRARGRRSVIAVWLKCRRVRFGKRRENGQPGVGHLRCPLPSRARGPVARLAGAPRAGRRRTSPARSLQ